ncbi:hypothetical protein [Paenibacillus gorillae]|uniref:hypothetical protein n=1 Tax=Paenibacillus gorillae TaxID=1243662 RepID=UPI0004B14C55|nr:hypothetical protein [Paenibacillus gorillae]
MEDKRKLIELLAPVRNRLTMFSISRYTLVGLLGGSFAGLLVLGFSRLLPMLHAKLWLMLLVFAGVLAGAVLGCWKRASIRDAAHVMDKEHTDDAVATALDGLERSGDNEPVIIRLQRQEALEGAGRYTAELRSRLPWPAWRNWRRSVLGIGAVWLLTVILLVWPNPLDDKAKAMAAAELGLEQLENQVEELAQQLDEAKLPEEAKRQVAETLEELRSKLEKANSAEALKELEEAIKKLEQTAEAARQTAEKLDAAADAMNNEPGLRKLGQALKDRDAAGMKQAIGDMRSELQRLTPEQKESIAKAMEKLAQEQPKDSALANALEQAAEQAREAGDGKSAGDDALSQLEEALGSELSQAQLEELARMMAERLAESGQAAAQQAQSGSGSSGMPGGASASGGSAGSGAGGGFGGGSGSEGQSGEQGQGGAGGKGSEAGLGEGSGSGAGSGQGSGSGSGSGQGSGSGTGSGSGSGGGGTGGLHGGTGQGGRGLITTLRGMEGSGNVQQDGGPSTGGQTQTTGDPSPMLDGMTRSYEDVYSEYAAEAKKALSRSQLPQNMQNKVKDYFDQIQPNR